MSIAPVNGLVLTLLEEKGILESQRMVLDQRRESLSYKSSEIYTQLTEVYASIANKQDKETTDSDSTEEFDLDKFRVQLQAQQAELDNQDKALELQRTNLTTKIDVVSTELEGAEKILSKNIENDMKGFS